MRLIDADALIKNIETDRDASDMPRMWYQGIEYAINHISHATTIAPEPQWIPCSERLPEHDGEMYLVTDYCKQINRKRIHISYCYMNREGFWSDVPFEYKVIAWMPLPEPYREEGEE